MAPGRDILSVRPVPLLEDHTAEYWEAARRREFRVQRCAGCELWLHPPRHTCPRCASEALTFERASGRGRVYGFTISHTPGGPGFEDVPYGIAVVELDEQPGLITVGNLLDCPLDEYKVGLPVEVAFEELEDGTVLPQWRMVL